MSIIPLCITEDEVWDYVQRASSYYNFDPRHIDLSTFSDLINAADSAWVLLHDKNRKRVEKKEALDRKAKK